MFPFLLKGIVLAMSSVGVGRGMLKQFLIEISFGRDDRRAVALF